jgi:hypothetical protein
MSATPDDPVGDDVELLRRHEPVLHFTRGEMFLPTRVEGYLQRCSLWRSHGRRPHQRLAVPGEITPDNLAELASGAGDYLRFVQEPMDFAGYRAWRNSTDRPGFAAVGRWARVGVLSRLLDAGFDISLSLRGVVPGGTVAVAEQQYRAMLAERPAPAYYGRVVREGGYIACHYLFFYVMNDFRSTFFGVNDHEADWEQVIVYLTEPGPGGGPEPVLSWVACAAHDLFGADLRRRHDDPELRLVDGRHPVVHVGAGSHAGYFTAGEYLFTVRPEPVRRAMRVLGSARQVWRESLGQGLSDPSVPDWSEAFAVPFIDYARGDGPRVGPGTDTPWDPVPLRGEEPWLDGYRGLWGLDTGDPFGGERAPAGPRYNRDGSVRGSWSDVLGFAGLDRVVPEPQLAAHLAARVRRLRFDLREAEQHVRLVRERLRDVELEHTATRHGSAGAVAAENTALAVAEAESALAAALSRRDHLVESDRSTAELLHRVEAGCPTDPRAHIRHRHEPEPTTDTPRWLAELWAASSGGLLLLVVATVLVLPTPHKLAALLAAVVLFLGLDATMRGRGLQFLLGYTVVAAVVAGAVLVVTYWQWSILLTIVLLVVAVVRGNLQELRFLRAAPNRERERAAAGDDGHA